MVGMVYTNVSGARPYGGVDAADRLAMRRARLLEAGLDLLGADVPEIAEVTVRGICRQAGLTARYFYESFADKDEFVSAVFDSVIADLAAKTQSMVNAAPPDQQTRAGIANIVRTVAGDARIGRLLFGVHLSNAVVVRKRVESSALLAMLSGQHARAALRLPENDRIKAAAHFVVGGVAQTISAWLTGEVRFKPEQLVEQLTALLDKLGDPALYRD
ncbi:MAG: TetR/AcrR family transcriptional regulator [Mycobacterium sp.]